MYVRQDARFACPIIETGRFGLLRVFPGCTDDSGWVGLGLGWDAHKDLFGLVWGTVKHILTNKSHLFIVFFGALGHGGLRFPHVTP